MPLYVTYDNTAVSDGIGAQVHRILCVMALARQFSLGYLHTGVRRVRYQGWASQTTGQRDADYVAKWESFLNLGHGLPTPESCGLAFAKTHERQRLRLWSAWWLARKHKDNELARIKSAYPVVDRAPAAYELVRDELRTRYLLSDKPPLCFSPERLNVAIHIRRGDVTPQSQWARRFVPNQVYVRLMRNIAAVAGRERVHFHIYSEGELGCPRDRFEELLVAPHVSFHLNEDVFSTFHHLARADVLVLGISSFSFVAGLYNSGVGLNFRHHNPQVPSWLSLKSSGDFDQGLLARRLAAMNSAQAAA